MVKTINARQLLSRKRLDLMAKYIYVEHKLQGYTMDWAQELYAKHIEAFSGGLYEEPGNPEKNTLQIFLDTFDRLIEDISTNGFDWEKEPVPVGADGILYNGAHRTAVCAYLNAEMPCEILEETCCFDYFYFKKNHLPDVYLDAMVTRYTQLFPEKCYVICLWPRACARRDLVSQADAILARTEKLGLVAAKTVPMNADAVRNFAIHCYCRHAWVGGVRQHFQGVDAMTIPRYDACSKMRVYVVESPDGETILETKQKLRTLFGMENYSVHSSDNPEETQMMMQLLFNANSVDMLNRGCVDYDVDLLERILDFKETVLQNGLNLDDFVLDSSSVMGLYKLRKVGDLDYLTVGAQEITQMDTDNNAEHAHYHTDSIETLVRNPQKHLYIMGVKCITLEVLQDYKTNRGRNKDIMDVRLIQQKQRNVFTLRQFLEVQWVNFRIFLRNRKAAARAFLEKHNIYFLTKLWHWLRGQGFE